MYPAEHHHRRCRTSSLRDRMLVARQVTVQSPCVCRRNCFQPCHRAVCHMRARRTPPKARQGRGRTTRATSSPIGEVCVPKVLSLPENGSSIGSMRSRKTTTSVTTRLTTLKNTARSLASPSRIAKHPDQRLLAARTDVSTSAYPHTKAHQQPMTHSSAIPTSAPLLLAAKTLQPLSPHARISHRDT